MPSRPEDIQARLELSDVPVGTVSGFYLPPGSCRVDLAEVPPTSDFDEAIPHAEGAEVFVADITSSYFGPNAIARVRDMRREDGEEGDGPSPFSGSEGEE